MPKCIYCREDKKPSDFNKDHVMPVAFGSFKNNFTLKESVCKECNTYFGEELELFLGRDTYEGLLRYKHGIKASQEFKALSKRLSFSLTDGEFKGLIIELKYDEEDKQIVPSRAKQIGIKKNTGEYVFFRPEELKSKRELEEEGFMLKGEHIIKICTEAEKDEINQLLFTKGIIVSKKDEKIADSTYGSGPIDIEISGTIDSIVFRGIAKIAFNYLSYVCGKNFALNENFRGIRNFIRYGVHNEYVFISRKPILQDEKEFGIKVTDGHIIALGWNIGKQALFAKVALFNWVNYTVVFSYWFDGIYIDIASGHHFNIKTKKISPLRHGSKLLLI